MGWFPRIGRRSDLSLSPEDLQGLSEAATLDELAALWLDWLNRELSPLACYGYVWSGADEQYRLVATMAPVSPSRVDPEPGYSGLMANAPTGSTAPLTLQSADAPPLPEVITLGGERWLIIPAAGLCLFRARFDRHHTIAKSTLEQLSEALATLVPAIRAIRRAETAQNEVDRLQTSLKASHLAARAILQPERSLEMLFRLPLSVLGAYHACLVVCRPGGEDPTLRAGVGKGKEIGARMLRGEIPAMLEIPVQPDVVTGDGLGIARAYGVESVARVPALQDGLVTGCAFYLLSNTQPLTSYQLIVLGTIGDRFSQLLASSQMMTDMSDQYLFTLHSLVMAMDALSPQTVGHSDRLARYARLTAREMGLSADEAEAVALAAYLHDVGTITLDVELINSANQLTPEQYDQVKEHAGLGAELVTAVHAAIPIAPAVQHHHERWDGHGYPHRLRGREIPLGARIIAACDLFEAKTTSRTHRKALPFARAIADVQAAAGTQLDPEVVSAFVRAIKRLGQTAAANKPVARCWVLRQVPAEICGECPNRLHPGPAACWEDPANLCSRHGDECAQCIVYTEVLARSSGGPADGEPTIG